MQERLEKLFLVRLDVQRVPEDNRLFKRATAAVSNSREASIGRTTKISKSRGLFGVINFFSFRFF